MWDSDVKWAINTIIGRSVVNLWAGFCGGSMLTRTAKWTNIGKATVRIIFFLNICRHQTTWFRKIILLKSHNCHGHESDYYLGKYLVTRWLHTECWIVSKSFAVPDWQLETTVDAVKLTSYCLKNRRNCDNSKLLMLMCYLWMLGCCEFLWTEKTWSLSLCTTFDDEATTCRTQPNIFIHLWWSSFTKANMLII